MSEPARSAELDALAELGCATVVEIAATARILDPAMRPIAPGTSLAGTAFTVGCVPGDNLAIHRALAETGPGDILAVDYGGDVTTGPFGEIMATAALARGSRGLVIDGAVRDTRQMAALGFPVFCRGRAVPGTIKRDPGSLGDTVRIGGVDVSAGDLVMGDDDAVMVIDRAELADILRKGKERLRREAAVMERLRAGETTLAVLGLKG